MCGKKESIIGELRAHVPFTAAGTATGILIILVMIGLNAPASVSTKLFWVMHPSHVLLSALVTTGMYRLHGGRGVWSILWIGWLGSVGVATLSDCIIPFVGEWLLDMPNRGLHIGFIDKWWLVNPLALAGIALGAWRPRTKIFHAAHVLVSTWASLFHITMAMGGPPGALVILAIGGFLFLAVWVPCCTSDIVFPLLFEKAGASVKKKKET
ncbi:MAG TPA: hypothetical protein DCZ94_20240 [Lentisphaeria bacterium]|nr:MAG: hypothetical protein A2X48_02525 [Lentisphaerae bacterium GWF2_49_21]HBC89277.1 hypothetical protein [Lentisphaeria bacterium]